MQTAMLSRQERGQAIAQKPNQVQRLSEKFYKVASQSREITYDVARTESFAIGWICNCPDFTHREVKCKHIWAVEFSLKLREKVREFVIQPVEINSCVFCHSRNLKKYGVRWNKCGNLQRFLCADCERTFSVNLGFEKMKHNPHGVTTAMQLYFSGESLRNTARSLRLLGVQVSHKTVFMWIKKYTALMEKYLDKITPQVSDTWRADELFLKVRGDMKYLYALMDDETRFWIAQQVTDSKYTADITPLFREGKKFAEKAPSTLITDGAFNFSSAYEKAFWRENKALMIQHIRHVRMSGDLNNNKMERMNGEIRDREKVMRSLKKEDTPILTGYQIFHNYIRPHMGINGKTPAELAGIKVKGKDKWLTLIQNASQEST
ncbi:MAG: DDE-type integrase/transposase/recombinase [Candidatus Bathyarchaeia archaeon]